MAKRRIEVVDASVLIDVIDIPMEAHDHAAVLIELDRKAQANIGLVLPIAAVVETSQHVQRIANGHDRRRCGQRLHDRVRETLDGSLPWQFVPTTWDEKFLTGFFVQDPPVPMGLVESLASKSAEAGDLLLLTEYRRLRESFPASMFDVDVWTLDAGLRGTVDHIRQRASHGGS